MSGGAESLDWLLPLALLVTHLATQCPAPTATLDEVWQDLITRAKAVGDGARALPHARTDARSSGPPGAPPPRCKEVALGCRASAWEN